MKSKKLLACLMAGTMVLSMAACGGEEASTPDPTQAPAAPTEAPAAEPTAEPAPEPVVEDASIDFEDGNMGFLQVYTVPANADAATTLEVVDFNGSKAVQITNAGAVPFVGIDVQSLLGDNTEKLASMELSIGVANPSGKFQAVSGEILAWSGEDLVESLDAWSVYMENANPKKAVATLAAGEEFVNGANNLFILNMKVDNAKDAGLGNSTLYIDNIRFLDKDGNLLTADSSVAFAGPDAFAGSGVDMSNLYAVSNAVNWEGYAVSGGAWSQAGVAFTDEVKAALVPGSVIEIDYASETGNMWVVMNESANGWLRVGVGDCDGSGQGYAYLNNSRNKAQITFEQIAQYCGDDVSTWGSGFQCESDGAWEVFSVKVGQAAPAYCPTNTVNVEGFAVSAGGWAQAGVDLSADAIAALVPGSVIEIEYASETGNMWTVWPGSTKGWMRVGVGDCDGSGQGYALCNGSKCYLTYEQIAEWLGDDVSAWGTTLQCESDGAWEVFSVKIGTASEFKAANASVNLDGFAVSAGGWAQAGIEMTPEFLAALVPGSVINIQYTSETGNMWTVWPGSSKGWMRVGVGNCDGSGQGFAVCDGSTCQISYETLVEWLGEDTSTWGTTLQCESDGAWEVFSVSVGYTK